jgi:hypothetical protein
MLLGYPKLPSFLKGRRQSMTCTLLAISIIFMTIPCPSNKTHFYKNRTFNFIVHVCLILPCKFPFWNGRNAHGGGLVFQMRMSWWILSVSSNNLLVSFPLQRSIQGHEWGQSECVGLWVALHAHGENLGS